MAAGADDAAFNSLWFLILIPIILIGLAIVGTVWVFISRRRKQKRRQSVLRNVPVIQAEAEAKVEKMERRASVRSKRSSSVHRHASVNGRDSSIKHDLPTMERDLTRSLSTRSQREVYARTLKARQHIREGRNPNSSKQNTSPPTFRLASSQSDTAHNRLSVPSHLSQQHRPRTPEIEEGHAGFPDTQTDSDGHVAQRDPDAHTPASDDSHTSSSRRYHQYRRQDANELSIIGEAEVETSQAGVTPSASNATAASRIILSPSSVLAAAVLAQEPEAYAAESESPVGNNASPFRDPEPLTRGVRPASSATETDASNTTFSSRQTTGEDHISPFGGAMLPSSETSGSTDSRSASDGPKLENAVAAPTLDEAMAEERDLHNDGTLAVDNASSRDAKSLTPTMTMTPGAAGGGSPAQDPHSKTPTMPRTPSPAALAREAQDRVDPIPDPEYLGPARLGGSYAEAGVSSTGLGLGSSSTAEASGAGAGGGGMAGRYLAPLLPSFLRPSQNNEGNTSRASLAQSELSTTTTSVSEMARGATSPHSPTTTNNGPALSIVTATPTKARTSMTSLRSALAAPTPAPQPMMPTRSGTGGSTGTAGGVSPSAPIPAGGVGGQPGGSAWTYTSRASEWKTASSTSVAAARAGGGGGGMLDPRASSTSLASRASSRDGHGRPGLHRKTSHGVAGSLY
ncbi:unnamed protein product, partial [Tilletia controversa]